MKTYLIKIIFSIVVFNSTMSRGYSQCIYLTNGYTFQDYFVLNPIQDAWKEISEGTITSIPVNGSVFKVASGCYIKPALYSYVKNSANCIQSEEIIAYRPTTDGPYQVKVDVKDGSCYVSKVSISTIFPDSWDNDKIKCEIIGVLFNPNALLVSSRNGRFTYRALASNSQFQIEIETTDRITPQNLLKDPVSRLIKCQVYTAYPVIE